jgi:PAS domain S-box-containing protein
VSPADPTEPLQRDDPPVPHHDRGKTARNSAAAEALAALSLVSSPTARPAPPPGSAPEDALFDLSPNGELLLDRAHRVVRANRAACAMLEVSPEALHGREFSEFADESSREELGRAFLTSDLGRTPGPSVHLRGRTSRGGHRPWNVLVRRLPGDGGYAVVLLDLAEQETLVAALAERGAQLARSNQDLQQFTYIASHDLQEPLRMISSYTQLLERRYRGRLDPDADEFLAYAQEGATRLQRLLDALVAYSRLDTRARPFAAVSMDSCVSDALANLRVTLEEQNPLIERAPLPDVEGDAVQLTQVFQNLISNALKFHGEERVRVLLRGEDEGPTVLYSVADNGIGIAPEYRDRIFVLFQRLHQREEYPGTGIGLAICKRVVERHGGTIWVGSADPRGAIFYFRLPKSHPAHSTSVAPEHAPVSERALERAQSLIAERLRQLV